MNACAYVEGKHVSVNAIRVAHMTCANNCSVPFDLPDDFSV